MWCKLVGVVYFSHTDRAACEIRCHTNEGRQLMPNNCAYIPTIGAVVKRRHSFEFCVTSQ